MRSCCVAPRICLIFVLWLFDMPPKPPSPNAEAIEANVIKAMREEFVKMKAEFSEVLRARDLEIDSLREKVGSLQKRVSKLEDSIDDGDAISRKNQILISGNGVPVVRNGENTVEVVKSLFSDHMNLVVPDGDIVKATRIGAKPQSQRPDNRYIQVTLSSNEVKSSILASCKRAKPPFYVNEFLTPRRSTIMYVLRVIKRKHPNILKYFCSRDGSVIAYTPGLQQNATGDRPARDLKNVLNTHGSLVRFCTEKIGEPLADFLQVWPH